MIFFLLLFRFFFCLLDSINNKTNNMIFNNYQNICRFVVFVGMKSLIKVCVCLFVCCSIIFFCLISCFFYTKKQKHKKTKLKKKKKTEKN